MEQRNHLKTSFYFAHGTKDKVVPYAQTKMFYDSLIKLKPHLSFIEISSSSAQHSCLNL